MLVALSDDCEQAVESIDHSACDACDSQHKYIADVKAALKDSQYEAAEEKMKSYFTECAKMSEGCATTVAPSAVMDVRMLGEVVSDACLSEYKEADIPKLPMTCEDDSLLDAVGESMENDDLGGAGEAMATMLTTCSKKEFEEKCATQVAPFVLNQVTRNMLESMKGLKRGLSGLGKMRAVGQQVVA